MRWFVVGIGVVLILLGGVWTVQGVGIMTGSPMTGQSFWATMGVLVLIVGVVLCYFGLRRKVARPPV